MTIAYACVLVAMFLPYLLVLSSRLGANVDQRGPRATSEAADGWRKRAYWAHQNAFEAFAPFAAAVLAAHQRAVPPSWVAGLALAFLLARVLHAVCYVADVPPLRTFVQVCGMGCTASLFGLAIRG